MVQKLKHFDMLAEAMEYRDRLNRRGEYVHGIERHAWSGWTVYRARRVSIGGK